MREDVPDLCDKASFAHGALSLRPTCSKGSCLSYAAEFPPLILSLRSGAKDGEILGFLRLSPTYCDASSITQASDRRNRRSGNVRVVGGGSRVRIRPRPAPARTSYYFGWRCIRFQ